MTMFVDTVPIFTTAKFNIVLIFLRDERLTLFLLFITY